MKSKIIITLGMLALASISGRAATVGTEFSYQGRLTDVTGPPSGAYDFTFTLHLAASGGVPVVTVTNLNTAVSNGLFTTSVDFGGGIYNGNAYWISLGVRSNGAGGSFTVLTPRQPLTPTPNASYASLAGTVPGGSITSAKLAVDSVTTFALQNNAVTAAKVASGQLVKSLNGLRDDVTLAAGTNVTITPSGNTLTLAGSSDWKLGGNTGTIAGVDFLGTTDNQALELKVNSTRALRVEPATNLSGTIFPNLIGGVLNSVAAGQSGSTIAGGRENGIASTHAVVSGGWRNQILAGSEDSAIVGGQANSIQANAGLSTIGAGGINQIGTGAYRSTVGGGFFNRILSDSPMSTIAGGQYHLISSNSSYATIGGGTNNSIGQYSSYATIAGGGLNSLPYFALGATISGGVANQIGSDNYEAVISGGYVNQIFDYADTSVIGGGYANEVRGARAVVPGGSYNIANGEHSFAAGYDARALHQGSFVWSDNYSPLFFNVPAQSTSSNQFVIRASGGIQLHPNTSLFCGTQTRQMLNLWGTQYGIGVQSGTVYFRCDNADPAFNGFIWYRGGVHDDNYANAGGGTEMMHLVASGLYVNGTIVLTSDRNAKENFVPVSPREVLDKVAALPISRWNYKEDKASAHLGPMAQDFYAAFGVGPDDKHIATVDADGVALAAIQGLNEKVEVRSQRSEVRSRKLEERLQQKETEITELKQTVNELKQLVQTMNHKLNGGAR